MRTRHPMKAVAAVIAATAVLALGFVGTAVAPASATPSPAVLSVFAGNGANTFPQAGPSLDSSIRPAGIAFDSVGNTYVADFANYVVVKITPSGVLSIVAGNGTWGTAVPGPALSSPMRAPAGLAIDSSDNLYIADYDGSAIYKVTPGGTLSLYAGLGYWATPTPGPATSSGVPAPWGLAFDSSDNLYIGEQGTLQVLKVTSGGTLSVFAGTGNYGTPAAGAATSADFHYPRSVAVDSSDNVYIGDIYLVMKVTPGGAMSVYAGNGSSSWSGLTAGNATSVPLGEIVELATDASGNLYLGDDMNYQIAKVDSSGYLSVYAGTHVQGNPIPGPALDSTLQDTRGMAVGPNGVLYNSDYSSGRVIRFSEDGLPTVPGFPQNLSAVAGDRSSTITFTAPYDGGSPITGYRMKIATGAWRAATCTTTSGSVSCSVTGLTNYSTPKVSFRAVNAIGESANSAPVGMRPRLTGPTIVSVTPSTWSAKVTFTRATIPSSTITGYTAFAYRAGTNTQAGSCRAKKTATSCVIYGLDPQTSYDVRVVQYFHFNASSSTPRETLPSNTLSTTTNAE